MKKERVAIVADSNHTGPGLALWDRLKQDPQVNVYQKTYEGGYTATMAQLKK
jgi:hypothetical protein